MDKPHSKQKDNISDTLTALSELKTNKKIFFPLKHQWLLRKKKKSSNRVDTGFAEAQLVSHFTGWLFSLRELPLLVEQTPGRRTKGAAQPMRRLCNSLLTEVGVLVYLPRPSTRFFPFQWFKAMVFPVCDTSLPVFQVYQRVYIFYFTFLHLRRVFLSS